MYFKNDILKVSVKYEESNVFDEKDADRGDAYLIYFTIFNVSSQKLDIKFLNTHIIHENIIKDKNGFLNHELSDFELFSNTGKEGVDVYLKSENEFNKGDKFSIKFTDLTNYKIYTVFFERRDSEDSLIYIDNEIIDINTTNSKELEKEHLEKNLLNSIERLSNMENKFGLDIQNLSINIYENSINVLGDLYIDDFSNYNGISLNATFYDENNKILETKSTTVYKDYFLGFKTFQLIFFGEYEEISKVKKIKLYPSVEF